MTKISLEKLEIQQTVVYKDLETQQFRVTVANTMFLEIGLNKRQNFL